MIGVEFVERRKLHRIDDDRAGTAQHLHGLLEYSISFGGRARELPGDADARSSQPIRGHELRIVARKLSGTRRGLCIARIGAGLVFLGGGQTLGVRIQTGIGCFQRSEIGKPRPPIGAPGRISGGSTSR